MSSKRSDGRLIKGLDPIFKLIPYLMPTRAESQVMCKKEVDAQIFDDYIKEKHAQGYDLSYMSVLIAIFVKIMAKRPHLNRFIKNGRIYAHNEIVISFVVKKALTDEADEMLLKLKFDGTENIFEINKRIEEEIKNIKKGEGDNATDELASKFLNLPNPIIKFCVKFLLKLDEWNKMPESVIKASPFHASLFITNVKSIKLAYIYHHLYNVGTAGIFMALGKTSEKASSNKGVIEPKNMFTLGLTIDERMCDGLYLAKSLQLFEKFCSDLSVLEQNYTQEEIVKDLT